MADREKFEAFQELLFGELNEDLIQEGTPAVQRDRFSKCLRDNTTGGKLNRGMAVVNTGHNLLKRPLTVKEYEELSILGWLTELFQAAYLIWDDIMDRPESRRGKPCWYRAEDVGLLAINDASLLKTCIFKLLHRHFRDHPEYLAFIELFNEAGFRTELGQLCDTSTASNDTAGDMTAEQYRFIAANKTAFYSFYLPVALGLHYVQGATEENLKEAQRVLLEIGEYFQIQDDVFGDPKETGNIGTDIRDNKCTWILIQALRLCNTDQRQMLIDSYGKRDPAHERRVLQLFKEIQIEKTYREFEERKLMELCEQIDCLDRRCGLEPAIFTSILNAVQRRNN
ncbi:isoprenoid synthase domain-containing protein [Aspergillus alliaceus]|uniref:Isoprenoid synthase domain-containing protein n=1 Tax=Petromyces alliaceus TaxID=209559 RepID=A0A5N7BR92_PETAA|nr:isoprenoid synthase domain-containing protein [Aspergillus alliaceus]